MADREGTREGDGGRAIWVVGATGRLGSAIAARLQADGYLLAISARSEKGLEEAAAGLEQGGGSVLPVAGDLTDSEWQVQAAAEVGGWLDARGAQLGGLVFAAGVPSRTAAWDSGPEAFGESWLVKVHAPLAITGICRERLEAAGGAVVLTAGVGREVLPRHFVGGMTNACVAYAVRSVGRELAASGIRVNALAPGVNEVENPERLPPEMVGAIAMGRLGRPGEQAAAVSFLLSSDASYVTGATLLVDGGLSRAV